MKTSPLSIAAALCLLASTPALADLTCTPQTACNSRGHCDLGLADGPFQLQAEGRDLVQVYGKGRGRPGKAQGNGALNGKLNEVLGLGRAYKLSLLPGVRDRTASYALAGSEREGTRLLTLHRRAFALPLHKPVDGRVGTLTVTGTCEGQL